MHSLQPFPTSAMTSLSHSTPWRHNSNTKNVTVSERDWYRNSFEIYGSALEHKSIFHVEGINYGCFKVFISGIIGWNCFSKMWRILSPRILQNNKLVLTRNPGRNHKWRLSSALYLYDALCTMYAVETMHYKPYYKPIINQRCIILCLFIYLFLSFHIC